MLKRGRGRYFSVVTAAFIVVLVVLFTVIVWDLAASNAEYRQSAENQAKEYADRAHERIAGTCIDLVQPAYAECVRQIIAATYEAQTAQHDLAAQRSMALWAAAMFWATLATVVVGAIGIYYVRNTLLEARRIGQAETRAYLVLCSPEIFHATSTFAFRPIIRNTGSSPARNVALVVELIAKPTPNASPQAVTFCRRIAIGDIGGGETYEMGNGSYFDVGSTDELFRTSGAKEAFARQAYVSAFYHDVFDQFHHDIAEFVIVWNDGPDDTRVKPTSMNRVRLAPDAIREQKKQKHKDILAKDGRE